MQKLKTEYFSHISFNHSKPSNIGQSAASTSKDDHKLPN